MPHFILAQSYLVLSVLALLEGPFIAIACGVGAGLGYLDPLAAYGILVAGSIVPDLLYYAVGRYGSTFPAIERFAARRRLVREVYLPLKGLWLSSPLSILLVGKLAYGVTPAITVMGGLARVPLARFLPASFIVATTLYGALGAGGFLLAHFYGYVNLKTGAAPYLIGLAGLAFLAFLLMLMRSARRRLPRG
jgi:membrane protein DedA with SNARE-associated domain